MTEQALTLWDRNNHAVQVADTIWPYLEDIARPRRYDMSIFQARLATQFAREPKLHSCTRESLIRAMVDTVSWGLELGSECYYSAWQQTIDNQKVMVCTFMVDYQGWARLLYDSGEVDDLSTGLVYRDDELVKDELNERYSITESRNPDRGPVTHAWCKVKFKDGSSKIEFIDRKDIERHKSRAQGKGSRGAWLTDENMQIRKSAAQNWAARNKGKIRSLNRVTLAVEEADELEYRNTALPEENIAQMITDLCGDDREALLDRGRNVLGELIDVGEALEESIAVEPEIPNLEVQNRKMYLRARMRDELGLKRTEVIDLIRECGGGDTQFEAIRDIAVLDAMIAKLKPAPHEPDALVLEAETAQEESDNG